MRIDLSNIYKRLVDYVDIQDILTTESNINMDLSSILQSESPYSSIVKINGIGYDNLYTETVPNYDKNLSQLLVQIPNKNFSEIDLDTYTTICKHLFRTILNCYITLDDEIFNPIINTGVDTLTVTPSIINILELKVCYSLIVVVSFRTCLFDTIDTELVNLYTEHYKFLEWANKLLNLNNEVYNQQLDVIASSIINLLKDSKEILFDISKSYTKVLTMGDAVYNNTFIEIDTRLTLIGDKLKYKYGKGFLNKTGNSQSLYSATKFPEYKSIIQLIKELDYDRCNQLLKLIEHYSENVLLDKKSFKYNMYNLLHKEISKVYNRALTQYYQEQPIQEEYSITTALGTYSYSLQNERVYLKLLQLINELINTYHTVDIDYIINQMFLNQMLQSTNLPETFNLWFQNSVQLVNKDNSFSIKINLIELQKLTTFLKFIYYTTSGKRTQNVGELGLTNYSFSLLGTIHNSICSKDFKDSLAVRFEEWDTQLNNILNLQNIASNLIGVVSSYNIQGHQSVYCSDFDISLRSLKVDFEDCFSIIELTHEDIIGQYNPNVFFTSDTPLVNVINSYREKLLELNLSSNNKWTMDIPNLLDIKFRENRFLSHNYLLTSPEDKPLVVKDGIPDYKLDTKFGGEDLNEHS